MQYIAVEELLKAIRRTNKGVNLGHPVFTTVFKLVLEEIL